MERREFDFAALAKEVPSLLGEKAQKSHLNAPCYFHVTSPETLSPIAKNGLWPSRMVQQKIASGELAETNLGQTYGYVWENSSCLPDNVCLTDSPVGVQWVKDAMYHSRLNQGVLQTTYAIIAVSRDIEKLDGFMSNTEVCATISEPFEGEVGVRGIIPPEYLLYARREFYRY